VKQKNGAKSQREQESPLISSFFFNFHKGDIVNNFCVRMLSISLGLLSLLGLNVQADTYPNKSIKLVVPYTPGGGTDILARMLSRDLSKALGVTVLIDNKPGADGIIGTDIVVKSPPDGYTLLIDGTSQAYNVAFGKKLPYLSSRDLEPVAQTAIQQVLLVVNTSLPINSVKELIAYAKANPGKLSYGSSSNANTLPMELLKISTGIDVVHIPYRGSGPMLTDLLGGQVQLAMSGAAAPLPHVKAGKLRVLGIGDSVRSSSLPEFPTIAEAGVPGFQTIQWSGIYAPKGTPSQIIEKLNQEIVKILKTPEFKKQLAAAGFDEVVGTNTPEAWRKLVADEVTKWSKIVDEAKLKPQ
jgi:tripartite-type tricarboxylate transporter receptor subunit TctC